MPEFDLIRRLQHRIAVPLSSRGSGCVVGIGDDGAVLESPPGRQLVVCTDTLNEGVHFPLNTTPRAIGHKALAVNLSDLAAMGAEPAWFFLNLSLPDEATDWLDEFAGGMGDLASATGILLAGGDTTSGPLSVTVTAIGPGGPRSQQISSAEVARRSLRPLLAMTSRLTRPSARRHTGTKKIPASSSTRSAMLRPAPERPVTTKTCGVSLIQTTPSRVPRLHS